MQWICGIALLSQSVALVAARPAAAQRKGIGVSPITVETDVQPGTTYTSVIHVEGPDVENPLSPPPPTRVKAYVLDWTTDPKGAIQFAPAGTDPGSCSQWIDLNPAEFDLKAGETQAVRYTLTVPATARGTYHTVIMFETGAQPLKVRGAGMSITGRIGTILYATAGPHQKSSRITAFSADAAGMSVTVENMGSDHLRLVGGVQVKDAAGKVVRDEKVTGAVVLPRQNNKRQVSLKWPQPLPPGNYTVTAVLDYGGEELLGAETQITVR